MTVEVDQITFGIEIECFVPAGTILAGGYHAGIAIPGFPEGWNAQRDSSLYIRSRNMQAVEIVSPVLKGSEGMLQVKAVIARLNAMGAKVNQTCGFHVHVGCQRDMAALRRLVHLVASHEGAIYAVTGTKNRERGHYCRPIRQAFSGLFAAQNGQMPRVARYHSLNVSNLIDGRFSAVEFRAFAGTLNFQKAAGYIALCVGIMERSMKMKRPAKWNAKTPAATSPIHRAGAGQTELTRLFYQLGWIKGRQSHVHGDLLGDGLRRVKKTLMRLARKYDAQQ